MISTLLGQLRLPVAWLASGLFVAVVVLFSGTSGCKPYVEKVPISVCMFNLRQMQSRLLEVAQDLGPEGLRRLDFSPGGSGWRKLGMIPSTNKPSTCPSASEDEGFGYVINPRMFYHPISEIADQDWLIADSAPRHNGYYWVMTKAGRIYKTRLLL
ncbi:MAG: hypothetical protein HRF45_09610 [Fimbriimonadia bacterium]